MPGEQLLEQPYRPFFEGLRKDGVVSVTKCVGDNVPSLVPFESLEINQDTLELNNGQRRMGIVQLDGHLVRELSPSALRLLEATNNVVQRRSNPEVLLLQAELLAAIEVVVWIQNSADGLGSLLVCHRALVVSTVELLEVKLPTGSFARPQSQVVGRWRSIAGDWHVVGHSLDSLATLPVRNGSAILVGGLLNVAVKLNLQEVSFSGPD